MRPAPQIVAKLIADTRFADAGCALIAGSIARGQATATSDIDLVLIHRHLPAAWRESLTEQGWPVEAFVHDLRTLQYFFDQIDGVSGIPSLASMVSEGLLIAGDEALAAQAKSMAQTALRKGPPAWDETARRASRYAVTDIVDDIRAPASRHTLNAALAQLYPALANHYLRSRGLWSAKGKTIPRRLAEIDASYADDFLAAFEQAFTHGETASLIALAEHTLQPDGGWLAVRWIQARHAAGLAQRARACLAAGLLGLESQFKQLGDHDCHVVALYFQHAILERAAAAAARAQLLAQLGQVLSDQWHAFHHRHRLAAAALALARNADDAVAGRRRRLAALALRHRLPASRTHAAMFGRIDQAAAGHLFRFHFAHSAQNRHGRGKPLRNQAAPRLNLI
ncbi:hypothetical protein [Chromobacterium alticapitis]|uniref:hypothetical protein n=1 Tax=Chromobacterium alticapitis TaxID=2073169 RepID=UPI00269BF6F9